ncbi:hypothetical protein [Curtobacterium sp. YR515]|uniref:hypothetical protein n=1 Tax=Curtobacterium sp. YR515 TaxID=1855316 RepID=UPI0008E5C45F|nr:hypothetical protein [Curtobacterium sp. YR515]SFF54734.1 hypothetical protein SAMN05216329_1435 [Curtobacterium sp. YR515]
MSETDSIRITRPAEPLTFLERVRFRLRAEREIEELTRDRAREDRIRAEAAVRLAPGPWHLAELFRRRP